MLTTAQWLVGLFPYAATRVWRCLAAFCSTVASLMLFGRFPLYCCHCQSLTVFRQGGEEQWRVHYNPWLQVKYLSGSLGIPSDYLARNKMP